MHGDERHAFLISVPHIPPGSPGLVHQQVLQCEEKDLVDEGSERGNVPISAVVLLPVLPQRCMVWCLAGNFEVTGSSLLQQRCMFDTSGCWLVLNLSAVVVVAAVPPAGGGSPAAIAAARQRRK